MTSHLAIARSHVEGQFINPRRLFDFIDHDYPSETGQKEEHLQKTWIFCAQGPANCRQAGKPVNRLVGACGLLAIPDIPNVFQPSPSPNFPLSCLFWEILVSLTSKSKKSLKLQEPKHSRSSPSSTPNSYQT